MSEEAAGPHPEDAEPRLKQLREPWWKPAPPDVLLKGAATLVYAAVGGLIFWHFRLPLAFMIGAMLFTAVAAFVGIPLQTPGRLRFVMISVLGVMLGSGFTAEAVSHFVEWIPSLTTLIFFMAFVSSTIAFFLHRYAGWDPVTAYFSGMPGGFSVMVILTEAFGGDERRVSLVHIVRIMFTVMTIPFWFRLFEGYHPSATGPTGSLASISPGDLAILVACAFVGFPVGRLLRLPSAALLGPTLVSGVVHYLGITHAKPPSELIYLAQIVIGSSVGCRFVGISILSVLGTLGIGAMSALFILTCAITAAIVLSDVTGLSFNALLLAFAPGGLAEMTLISLALGIDVAFVSTHHMLRIAFMMLSGPVAFRALRKYGVFRRISR